MGNNIGRKKTTKVMKIDGEIFKLKLPATAAAVLGDYPETYVLLESESVKRFGIRAPRLRPEEELKPKKTYFLVDMPKFPEERQQGRRRVGPGVNTGGAHDRLELLMLRQKPGSEVGSGNGTVRVKIRVPKAQILKLMEESGDDTEVAERIVHLCLQNKSNKVGDSRIL